MVTSHRSLPLVNTAAGRGSHPPPPILPTHNPPPFGIFHEARVANIAHFQKSHTAMAAILSLNSQRAFVVLGNTIHCSGWFSSDVDSCLIREDHFVIILSPQRRPRGRPRGLSKRMISALKGIENDFSNNLHSDKNERNYDLHVLSGVSHLR